LPIVKKWQESPLEKVSAVIFMDAIGMYVGENESAKFWLSIMNGLKNRGVEDIIIACVDGLSGFR
jgi:transposase-like protein